ncbi:hypothetical protein [Shewanella sp. S1-58-MNA-CIBAN-0166]|uniref:hypothetical protein n=1 Tax=Shewanella sp. S1-58-MNA-CIBAN-0166 TaxID=3140467 RepID=UPI003330FC4E
MLTIVSVAILYHVLSIYYSTVGGFTVEIPEFVIINSTLDLFVSILVVFFIKIRFPSFFMNANSHFQNDYVSFFNKYRIVFLLVLIYTGYLASQSFQLILLGIPRHELLQEYGTGGISYMLISGFFKMLFPFVFFFNSNLYLKLIATIGLLFTIVLTASRSELMYVIGFYLILLIFSKSYKKVFWLLFLTILMIFIAILSTVFLQNRPITDGFGAFSDMLRTVFQYRAYSYYLAEYSIDASVGGEKVLFPFFGYIAEYFSRLLSPLSNPIDSDFVSYLHVLGHSEVTGRPFLANVLYPWWSWFYGAFGSFGIILKGLYCFILLAICVSGRFLFTFVIVLSFIIFGTAGAHPLLTLTHTFAVATCFIIDLAVFLNYKFSKGNCKL